MLRVTAAAVTAVVALSACGPREAGPLPGDKSQVQYWKVVGSKIANNACSDDPAGPISIKAPDFKENSYLVYKIAADGKTAVAQDCKTTASSSCVDSTTNIVFDVVGHELTWHPKAEVKPVSGTTCQLQLDQSWLVEDQGEKGLMTVALTFDLVTDPPKCDALDAQIKANSPNHLGIRGCVVTLTVDTTFRH